MFDTHAHLNFKRFEKNVDEVIKRAFDAGIINIVAPGTDIVSSKKAVEIAEKYGGVYASVGIHPHHAFNYLSKNSEKTSMSGGKSSLGAVYSSVIKERIQNDIDQITQLIKHPKVVAIGEIGIDKHMYKNTKYEKYNVSDTFVKAQHELFSKQIKLAIDYDKSLIVHNREAVKDILMLLDKNWHKILERRSVLHCCEPDYQLLAFAIKHRMYIGVDGDVTYDKKKKEFIKQVPIEMLVLETDSPFLLPEPLKTQNKYPNEPKNLAYISGTIAKIKNIPKKYVEKITFQNGIRLFNI